jgi:Tol biopolymer transport system component
VRWTVDGRNLTYIKDDNGVSNIWNQPLSGGPPQRITSFKSGRIFNFNWSHDGKYLALARGSMSGDVVLIRDVR